VPVDGSPTSRDGARSGRSDSMSGHAADAKPMTASESSASWPSRIATATNSPTRL
jgi:hypothetical protein